MEHLFTMNPHSSLHYRSHQIGLMVGVVDRLLRGLVSIQEEVHMEVYHRLLRSEVVLDGHLEEEVRLLR